MLDSKLFERTLIEPAKNADRLVVVSGYASAGMVESHNLPLYIEKRSETHSKAGLNWGQRGTRNRDEAYIPIPSELQYRNSDFFLLLLITLQ